MRKALGMILLAGLFLLMLSALVVTPEDAMPPPPSPPVANVQAVFMPVTPMADGLQAVSCATLSARQAPGVVIGFLPAAMLPVVGACDSNGRILRHARYENSVYQVFRPEVAGG